VVHVVQHTAQARSLQLLPQDRDDLCAEVFLNIVKDDFAILRHFRGKSSLATYLTVVARRIVVKKLLREETVSRLATVNAPAAAQQAATQSEPEARLSNQEEVQQLLNSLEGNEADVVRMYHLEGKSYHEISSATGMPENSIGPMLSRARGKLRRNGVKPASG
jgi:RNA polymerase sigma-70 factor (ECF subfamily)